MTHDQIESCGLDVRSAAAFVGMSRSEFEKRVALEQAPAGRRIGSTKAKPRWSIDELRAWVAHGYPPADRWRAIWAKMLANGTWCPARIVQLTGGGDAA
ncbi:MAG: hypothetical protein AAFQ53_05435 [Bacteroidota bacterium]